MLPLNEGAEVLPNLSEKRLARLAADAAKMDGVLFAGLTVGSSTEPLDWRTSAACKPSKDGRTLIQAVAIVGPVAIFQPFSLTVNAKHFDKMVSFVVAHMGLRLV